MMNLVDAWRYIVNSENGLPKEPISLEEIEIINKIRNLYHAFFTDSELWQGGFTKGWESCFKDLSYRLHEVAGEYEDELNEEIIKKELDEFYKEAQGDTSGKA